MTYEKYIERNFMKVRFELVVIDNEINNNTKLQMTHLSFTSISDLIDF